MCKRSLVWHNQIQQHVSHQSPVETEQCDGNKDQNPGTEWVGTSNKNGNVSKWYTAQNAESANNWISRLSNATIKVTQSTAQGNTNNAGKKGDATKNKVDSENAEMTKINSNFEKLFKQFNLLKKVSLPVLVNGTVFFATFGSILNKIRTPPA